MLIEYKNKKKDVGVYSGVIIVLKFNFEVEYIRR